MGMENLLLLKTMDSSRGSTENWEQDQNMELGQEWGVFLLSLSHLLWHRLLFGNHTSSACLLDLSQYSLGP